MKLKIILLFCIPVISSAATTAQTPPPPPASPDLTRNAGPSPEAQLLATQISNFATAQCGGKTADAAPDCRIKALWAATQCPETMSAPPASGAKPESSACAVPEPGFEYEVSSIKPHNKDDAGGFTSVGGTGDGYRETNSTMKNFVINAFSTGLKLEVTGEPSWANDIRYDIEGKYTLEVARALRKLSSTDRQFVLHYMMKQLLKERMNFAARVEMKEAPAYDLVVGKNGPRMKAYDPNSKENGTVSMRPDQGKTVLTGKGMLMSSLAWDLTGPAGRPVFDKTGLTGMYDVTLEFVREQNSPAAVPGEGPSASAVVTPPDPVGLSLVAAIESQLGLKLVPSRGPVQVIVIDHMDKPSAN